jgi:murein DD-endopeptidase MepM/ murein hydrolase activator NlpD
MAGNPQGHSAAHGDAAVLELQQLLVNHGYLTQAQMDTGRGVLGPKTRAALSRVMDGEGPIAAGESADSESSGGASTTPRPPMLTPRTHRVRVGDSLSKLALDYDVTLEALVEINGIQDARLIWVGQVLTLPRADSSATPRPVTPPADSSSEPSTSSPPRVTPRSPATGSSSAHPAAGGAKQRIDFAFISSCEGGQSLRATVPDADHSQSGVTVATGFDLGCRDARALQQLGLSQDLRTRLSKYLGKQGSAAERFLATYPLTITQADADEIDVASKKSAASTVIKSYNRAVANKSGLLSFEQLPGEAQTVIASVAFQYGDLSERTPKFWKAVTAQRWKDVIEELLHFGDRYDTRREKEAALLRKMNTAGGRPTAAAPPASSFPVLTSPLYPGAVQVDPRTKSLGGSVGQGGKNAVADVQLVQSLLNLHLPAPRKQLVVNGVADQQLINEILQFQRSSLGLSQPDGRVDVGGRTFLALTGKASQASSPGATPGDSAAAGASTGFCFPFSSLPGKSWKTEARAFGARRSNGMRKHAGCDLYFPKGTWIHAVADGEVIAQPYDFYCGTQAMEIRHGSLIVRYGEIKPRSFVGGTTVKRGQRICQVGHLVGINVESDMLHIEIYSGTASGPLTVKGKAPYMRRGDLLDPTPYLDRWSKNLPPP